jgi:hypothetical protein
MSTQISSTPQVLVVASQTGLSAAKVLINAYSPASGSLFLVHVYINVVSWVTPASFSASLAFNTEVGGSATPTLQMTNAGATSSGAITAVSLWQGSYYGPMYGTITVQTTGTFTGSPVYSFYSTIMRMG